MQVSKNWHWRKDMEFNDMFFCLVVSLVARKILAKRVRVRVLFWCFRKFEEKLGIFFFFSNLGKKIDEIFDVILKFVVLEFWCFKKVWENVGEIWWNLFVVCYDIFFQCLCWISLFFIHCFHNLLQFWFLLISFGFVLILTKNVFGHIFHGFFFSFWLGP